MLGHRICHCSVGLAILQLRLRPSFILDIKSILALDLHIGIVDLSPRDWTCHSEAVLNLKSGMCLDLRVGTLDFSVRHWTCHFEAGPSAQLHSCFWTGFIVSGLIDLHTKSLLFLDLNVGTLDLSPQHWTCHSEAGLSALLQP